MSQRLELVRLMLAVGANVAELCRRRGVSRKTAYKWLARYRAEGEESAALCDRSRRPHDSPRRSDGELERQVVELRGKHPAWGGRKLRRRLPRQPDDAALPAASTVTAILRRHGMIDPRASAARVPFKRFERPAPNDLWQMDFKSPVRTLDGREHHPLTVLDDHSRFALTLSICADQCGATVRSRLTETFGIYGLPAAVLCDNGPPWGVSHSPLAFSTLSLWLLRLDVPVLHGRPYHPQTQGKDERFHGTIEAEVLSRRGFDDGAHAQRELHAWRDVYNQQRPHEALGMDVPAQRYHASPRGFNDRSSDDGRTLQWAADLTMRKVNAVGRMSFGGVSYQVGEAFAGEPIGLRATRERGVHELYYGRWRVGTLDERDKKVAIDRRLCCAQAFATLTPGHSTSVTHVSEHLSPMCPA
jgi:transposase InsO family protein